MRGTAPRDAPWLLAVAAGLAVLVLARHAAPWLHAVHGTLLTLPRWFAGHRTLAAGAAAAGATVLAARVVVVRRLLASREGVRVVAADSFDPSMDAVLAFAGQLARTRRSGLGWLERPAAAVSVQFARRPGEALVSYQLTCPKHASGVLASALGNYTAVQARPEPQAKPAARSGQRGRVARAELVLARSSSLGLRESVLDPDPLQALAGVLGALGEHEDATVSLSLLAVTAGERRRLQRRLAGTARRESEPGAWQSLLDTGCPKARGPASPMDLVERRAQTRALHGKLGTPQPLFHLQLLVRAGGPSRRLARGRLRALLSCFDAMAGENHLRAAGLRLGGLGILGSDLPWHRRAFDRRLRTGRFRPRKRCVVSAAEVAGLLKPPTVHCESEAVERSGGIISAPPAGLPTFTGQPDLIPLGEIHTPAGPRRVGVPVDRTIFSYMAGRSRYGKTETAIGQFIHLARAGHGGLFLDPHSDAITKIKPYLTDPGIRERVVEIDLADLAGTHGQPGWNLLATHGMPAWESDRRVDAVVDAFAAALGWDDTNTRALNLITQSAQAMTELARALPRELAPTLFQIPTLLSNEEWRQAVLASVSPATRGFFTDRFPRLPAEAITPVTNLIDRLRAARPVAALFGSAVSTFDMQKAMNEGLIVLACPGTGSTRDRLVANLLVYEVLHAARTRISMNPSERRLFFLFLDELQTYDGPNLPALLEQSAKYGVRAFLLNQSPERLTSATLNAVTTNRSHLLTTTVNAKAAAWLSREYGGVPDPQTITRLARYTYLASVTIAERASDPFLVHGLTAHELHARHHHPEQLTDLDQAIDTGVGRAPVQQTLASLDTHERRIVEHLQAAHSRATGGQPCGDGSSPDPSHPGQPLAESGTRLPRVEERARA